jgi:hypothetical protein
MAETLEQKARRLLTDQRPELRFSGTQSALGALEFVEMFKASIKTNFSHVSLVHQGNGQAVAIKVTVLQCVR